MGVVKSSLLRSAALATLMAAGFVGHARADYGFSGTGTTGFLNGSSEPWNFANGGWGSPGISFGITQYTQSQAAYGFEVTFTGAGESMITPGSIAIGNAANCAGDSTGGSTFCTLSPTDIWKAFQLGPDSVEFLAQNASFFLSTDQYYFVNILFSGALPTGFTGAWLTEFTPVPEPASLAMAATGILALAGLRRRRAKSPPAPGGDPGKPARWAPNAPA